MANDHAKEAAFEDDEYVLLPEQEKAYESLENSDENIFLTGKAGTGKSVLLRYFIRHTRKNVAVLAPTGIAAVNVNGETIHSFFRCDKGVQRPESADEVYNFDDEHQDIYRKLDAIVIDEISMVRADIMEMINAKLQAAREEFFEPFGGCQMIVFGDLYQLPPVPEKDQDAKIYLKDKYETLYFFSAPVVKAFPFTKIELQHIHRQSDERFIQILNAVRTGEANNDVIQRINSRCLPVPAGSELVTLTGSNKRAERINSERLAALSGEEFVYEGLTDGLIDPKDLMAEQVLRLKVGARVIMIKNDPKRRWVNGTIGKISQLTQCSVSVEIDGVEHLVTRDEWDTRQYKYNQHTGTLMREKVGRFIQFPIKLAYAMTVHKSQGQTYNGAIIDLESGAFAAGQTYVALSRCRSYDQLYIRSPLRLKDVQTDPGIAAYMSTAKTL